MELDELRAELEAARQLRESQMHSHSRVAEKRTPGGWMELKHGPAPSGFARAGPASYARPRSAATAAPKSSKHRAKERQAAMWAAQAHVGPWFYPTVGGSGAPDDATRSRMPRSATVGTLTSTGPETSHARLQVPSTRVPGWATQVQSGPWPAQWASRGSSGAMEADATQASQQLARSHTATTVGADTNTPAIEQHESTPSHAYTTLAAATATSTHAEVIAEQERQLEDLLPQLTQAVHWPPQVIARLVGAVESALSRADAPGKRTPQRLAQLKRLGAVRSEQLEHELERLRAELDAAKQMREHERRAADARSEAHARLAKEHASLKEETQQHSHALRELKQRIDEANAKRLVEVEKLTREHAAAVEAASQTLEETTAAHVSAVASVEREHEYAMREQRHAMRTLEEAVANERASLGASHTDMDETRARLEEVTGQISGLHAFFRGEAALDDDAAVNGVGPAGPRRMEVRGAPSYHNYHAGYFDDGRAAAVVEKHAIEMVPEELDMAWSAGEAAMAADERAREQEYQRTRRAELAELERAHLFELDDLRARHKAALVLEENRRVMRERVLSLELDVAEREKELALKAADHVRLADLDEADKRRLVDIELAGEPRMAELAAAEDAYAKKLEVARYECRQQLAEAAGAHAEAIDSLKAEHAAELDSTAAKHEQALEGACASRASEIGVLESRLGQLEARRAEEIDGAEKRRVREQASAEEWRAADAKHAEESRERELAAADARRRSELDAAEARRAREVAALAERHATEMSEAEERRAAEVAEVEATRRAQVQALERKYDAIVETAERERKDAIDLANDQLQTAVRHCRVLRGLANKRAELRRKADAEHYMRRIDAVRAEQAPALEAAEALRVDCLQEQAALHAQEMSALVEEHDKATTELKAEHSKAMLHANERYKTLKLRRGDQRDFSNK